MARQRLVACIIAAAANRCEEICCCVQTKNNKFLRTLHYNRTVVRQNSAQFCNKSQLSFLRQAIWCIVLCLFSISKDFEIRAHLGYSSSWFKYSKNLNIYLECVINKERAFAKNVAPSASQMSKTNRLPKKEFYWFGMNAVAINRLGIFADAQFRSVGT